MGCLQRRSTCICHSSTRSASHGLDSQRDGHCKHYWRPSRRTRVKKIFTSQSTSVHIFFLVSSIPSSCIHATRLDDGAGRSVYRTMRRRNSGFLLGSDGGGSAKRKCYSFYGLALDGGGFTHGSRFSRGRMDIKSILSSSVSGNYNHLDRVRADNSHDRTRSTLGSTEYSNQKRGFACDGRQRLAKSIGCD